MGAAIRAFLGKRKTRFVFVCIVALFFTLAFYPFLFGFFYIDLKLLWEYIPSILVSIGYAYLFWFCMICMAGISRFFAYGILPVISIIQFTSRYASGQYGARDIRELTYVAIDATWKEVAAYIDLRNIILFSFLIVGAFVGVYILRCLSPLRSKRKNKVILLSILSILLALPLMVKAFLPSVAKAASHHLVLFIPLEYQTLNNNLDLFLDKMIYRERDCFLDSYFPVQSSRIVLQSIWSYWFPEPLKDASVLPLKQARDTMPGIVVLYIGESFRSDHSPFNGYRRNTTPKLLREKNIINLPAVHSRKTNTLSSIYSILTDTNPKTLKPEHGSFISILKKGGIGISLLVSENTEGKWYKFPTIYPLLNGYIDYMVRPGTNEDYRIQMNNIQQVQGPQFILIEDGTGHYPYAADNQTYGRLDARCMEIENPAIQDCYDNCLIDTDARLHAIIDTLRDKDAILLYTSDHGESLGENGYYGHGGPVTIKEQTHVFAFIWYSDLYKERRPDIIEALEQNASRFVSHDYIYHTIISMCGLASDVQRPEQDMTRPQPQEKAVGQQ